MAGCTSKLCILTAVLLVERKERYLMVENKFPIPEKFPLCAITARSIDGIFSPQYSILAVRMTFWGMTARWASGRSYCTLYSKLYINYYYLSMMSIN